MCVNEHFEESMDITVTDQENSRDIELFIIGEFLAPKRLVSKEIMEAVKASTRASLSTCHILTALPNAVAAV